MDLMIDLETLDQNETSAIVAIGAVPFDPLSSEVGKNVFFETITIESALEYGTYSEDTIDWWDKQSVEAKSIVFPNDAGELEPVIKNFVKFIKSNKLRRIWGNSPRFDVQILCHAFKRLGISFPFKYWNEMDVRTLHNTLSDDPELKSLIGKRAGTVVHSPVDDCFRQIQTVQNFYQLFSLIE